MSSNLLTGIRAVEACEVWAGPMGGSLLGDLGAEVVKVESFPRSSMTRPLAAAAGAQGSVLSQGADGPAYEISGIHHLANRNKRNIAVDVRSEGGTAVMHRLIAQADVFFEGYSAGTMERLGFGWERVREINPRVVMVSMPGWGVEGPYQGYVTLGSGLDAGAGHASIRGYPDRDPSYIPGIFHSDATGALALVTAVVAGLRRREQSGEGCFIDMSQIEVLTWQLPGVFAEWTMNQRRPQRLGNVDPHIVPHGCYRAAGDDSWVVIAAETDRQWAGLAALIGHARWAKDGDPRASVPGRLRAREEIDSAIATFTATAPADEIADRVQEAGAIAAPTVDSAGLLGSPQLNAREWFNTVEHRYTGSRILNGFLWTTTEHPPSWDRACGLVGEHNDEVLVELGYSGDEIAALAEKGVIGDRYELPSP
ncbi:MAG: CoA transferase [Dehalococcoidia bacterium]|jgi:crotonobetainyl-CoA:carnitine CoA-transferase CaiB-like acyl-CoA transferase|nr:CoA transferase [Dehalococcoidia bacterium]